jgi:hypothetical protein
MDGSAITVPAGGTAAVWTSIRPTSSSWARTRTSSRTTSDHDHKVPTGQPLSRAGRHHGTHRML